ncbi:hypothetical protein GRS96_07510 [Rathayibacter sp. VKM Ac-2803]|uniref:hypothetical protein n=1 Tax=unclassified Rathayibacter TaxID=2609250 RepID=UPI00135B49D6|nr:MULTISPECIES: hypothetical protein [unclassified Rathayibacter]MWV49123.1 hypothetical protein [Rathayibacter sp. VKM Ac-2803]MWV58385.1 hypothetical protein [Rathayibacter sp. VKM Ac-2754]
MRRLHYASGFVLVADITCKAVLRYARALADVGKSDVVTIPVVTEGGSNAYAHLLIGPGSQLFSIPVEKSHGDEPVDEDVIASIERETRRMQPARPAWSEEMTDISDLDFLDFSDQDTGGARLQS